MGSTFGRLFKVSTFGESHGGAVGVILDGCPPKLELDIQMIQIINTMIKKISIKIIITLIQYSMTGKMIHT